MNYIDMISTIETLCHTKGISKTTAYIQSGVGKDFGANIKKGNIPSTEKVKALADYLNCSIDYLLGRTDNPQAHIGTETDTQNALISLIKMLTPEQQELVAAQIKGILASQTKK